MQPSFPFTAIVAQERLKTALQLISIDPKIGGLLLSGPRGSAKSTMVRSLASLNHGQSFITVPLGASEEMVTGSFDLGKALNDAEVAFRDPGKIEMLHLPATERAMERPLRERDTKKARLSSCKCH